MTLPELIHEVHARTHFPQADIVDLVRQNWTPRAHYTETQAALLVQAIERRQSGGAQ